MSRFGMVGGSSGDLLSFGGAIIVHGNRAEMQWLFPTARVVRVSDGDLGQPVLRLQDHPDMSQVRFPLRRQDFPDA